MKLNLKNKIALVTGATSGIGRVTAKALAEEGARLILSGRNEERGRRLLAELALSETDGRFVAGDLTDPHAGDRLIDSAVQTFGRLDILVNSAGLFRQASIDQTDDELWRQIMAINVDAVFYLCRAAIRQMQRQKDGVIVNIAGDWGLKAAENVFAYCVSKAAVVQMARSITADYARANIRINTVCPGDVDTPMFDSFAREQGLDPEEARRRALERSPNGRIATPQDVAAAVLYLASDAARHITGIALPVEGGSLAV